MAINQPRLDMPEILWKSYIDFEVEMEETDRARLLFPFSKLMEILRKVNFFLHRELYRRLLAKTQHVKVWLSLAKFEQSLSHESNLEQARHTFEEGNKSLRDSSERNPEAKEHRVMLLEAWLEEFFSTLYSELINIFLLQRKDFEAEHGDTKAQETVDRLMPRRVKRRRKAIEDEEGGNDGGWEEYFDYIFPEDEIAKPNLKLLAMAKMWKKQKNEEPGKFNI